MTPPVFRPDARFFLIPAPVRGGDGGDGGGPSVLDEAAGERRRRDVARVHRRGVRQGGALEGSLEELRLRRLAGFECEGIVEGGAVERVVET